MNMEQVFRLLADMRKLTSDQDKLGKMIDDALGADADELTEADLDFLSAAGPEASGWKAPKKE